MSSGTVRGGDLLRQLVLQLGEVGGGNGPGVVARRRIGGVTVVGVPWVASEQGYTGPLPSCWSGREPGFRGCWPVAAARPDRLPGPL